MQQNSVNAYTAIHKESLSGRELEASVLSRAGLMLKSVKDNWNAPDRDHRNSDRHPAGRGQQSGSERQWRRVYDRHRQRDAE